MREVTVRGATEDRPQTGAGSVVVRRVGDGPDQTPLADAVRAALRSGSEEEVARLWGLADSGPRDRFLALIAIYELHTAPLDEDSSGATRWQHHPAVAAIKTSCETAWLEELATVPIPADSAADVVGTLRTMAARNRRPGIYSWLAHEASYEEVVTFLSREGGPDAGFDDLVAACQVGLSGAAKMELATNYWDEMGDGEPTDVHTTLHDDLVRALGIVAVPRSEQSSSALARAALCPMLATNRWLQPEMLGALGLIELEAGPRCRLVLQALERVGAPAAAFPFYEVHADVDPRHGKDWLEKVVGPVTVDNPEWAERVVRGAAWREVTNNAFLDEIYTELVGARG